MRRILFLFLLVFSFSTAVEAQAANTNSKLAWDQDVEAVVPTVAVANSLIYKYYADGVSIATGTLTGVVCVTAVNNKFPCQAPLPAFTVGNHTLAITGQLPNNTASEAPKSNVISFTFSVIVSASGNVRIIP